MTPNPIFCIEIPDRRVHSASVMKMKEGERDSRPVPLNKPDLSSIPDPVFLLLTFPSQQGFFYYYS
jgi:hypothetical protein